MNLKLKFLDKTKTFKYIAHPFFFLKVAKYDSKEIAKDQEEEDDEAN